MVRDQVSIGSTTREKIMSTMTKRVSAVTSVALFLAVPSVGAGVTHASPSAQESHSTLSGVERGGAGTDRATYEPAWLSPGPNYQYPSTGGTWKYGFWSAKVRSYYTVNRCHGSTVELNGDRSRSVNTRSGVKSIAEKWAVNYWGNDDAYYYRVC